MSDLSDPEESGKRPRIEDELTLCIDRAIRKAAECLLANRDEREDLVGDAWTRVVERWRDLKDVEKAPAWAASITRRVFVDWARKRRKEAKAIEELERDPTVRIPMELSAIECRKFDQVVLDVPSLNERQRDVIVLKYWLDLSWKHIASLMGCPVNAIHCLHQRAKDELYVRLETTFTASESPQEQNPLSTHLVKLLLCICLESEVDKIDLLIRYLNNPQGLVPEEFILRAKALRAHVQFAFSSVFAISSGGGGIRNGGIEDTALPAFSWVRGRIA